jgi:hypothetical protein
VIEVRLEHGELRSGAPVEWRFAVVNRGAAPATLAFRSGQRGDVALGGYRWSRDRMFLQALGSETVAPGETWRFTLEGELDVPPGSYDLVATVTARPELVVRERVEVAA